MLRRNKREQALRILTLTVFAAGLVLGSFGGQAQPADQTEKEI